MSCSSCQQNNHIVNNPTTNSLCECACGCAEPTCPTPQPCTEITDAKCIIYTGAPINCELDTVVTTNATVSTALNQIVTYFCENGGIGPAGPQGPQGSAGINGTNGINGINGTNGTNGTNGIDGIDGTNGVNGTNGIQGPIGPTGPTGSIGPTGPQGEPGLSPAGLTWQGTYDPATTYNVDDVVSYLGSTYWVHTGPVTGVTPSILNANWALLGSVGATGPTGPTGATGATGATGPTGATGATGAAGTNGTNGANGTNGTNGTNGATGPIGPQGPAGTGNDVTLSSIGAGLTLVNDGVGPTLVTKSIQAGSGVTMTSTSDVITISSSGGGGASNSTVETFVYSFNNIFDNFDFFNDGLVKFGWDAPGNDLEFYMLTQPTGSGFLRGIATLNYSTQVSSYITAPSFLYDLFPTGVPLNNQLNVIITAENDVNYPIYQVDLLSANINIVVKITKTKKI